MKTTISILVTLLLCALGLSAQTSAPAAVAPASTGPTYLLGGGASFSPYSTAATLSQKASAVGVFAIRIGSSNLLSWSTMSMTPGDTTGATLRTGAGYIVMQQEKWALTAIGTAGVALGGTVTLGTFAGGGVLSYEFKPHLYFAAGLTVESISSSVVKPSFAISFVKGF